ncbi:hypothetical protein ACOME3_010316 [Neoechinorhynchus agilis]
MCKANQKAIEDRTSNLGKRSIIVTAAIIVIIIATVSAIQVYKQYQKRSCQSPACLDLSRHLQYLLNDTMHPCEDFYEYVCHNWIRDNPVPPGRPTWGILSQMRMNNLNAIFQSLNSNEKNFTQTERAASTYFHSCMKDADNQPRGLRSFYKRFEKCTGFSFKDWITRSRKFLNTRLRDVSDEIMIQCGYQLIFGIFVHPDDLNSTNMAVYVERPVLLFGVKEFYQSQFLALQKVYIDVIQRVIDFMFPFDNHNVTRIIKAVIDFDKKIADAYSSLSESRELRYLKKIQIGNLTENTSSFMDFQGFVNAYISPSNRSMNSDDFVSVTHEKSLLKIIKVFSDQAKTDSGKRLLIDYMCLKLLAANIDFMPDNIQKAILPFRNSTLGLSKYPDRWETCVLLTRQAVPHGTASLFIRNNFNPDIRTKLNDIYILLKSEFEERIRSRSWLDNKTMEHALAKLHNMKAWFGYPDLLLNKTVIDAKYDNLEFSDDDFFENFLLVKRKTLAEKGKTFGMPKDQNDYGADVDEENASYDNSMNKIRVYAGILMPPGFEIHWPPAMIYGSIGYVIAHELIHGFDDQGRMFDGQGNQHNWWNNYAEKQFHVLSKCFVDQYSEFKVGNMTLNGELTLGENIADNGGLRLAYNAYKSRAITSKYPETLPNINLTPDQLFFISFALYWCESSTPRATEYYLLRDFHALPRFRVQGTIRNMPEFSKVFNCPANEVSNEMRCELW